MRRPRTARLCVLMALGSSFAIATSMAVATSKAVATTDLRAEAARVTPCVASQLTGNFREVPGSPAAGSVTYALRLRNKSAVSCSLTGLPQLQLRNKSGKALPTKESPAAPGAGTAILDTLKPGSSAWASARFSPDVPGPGEPTTSRTCEPTAYLLRVAELTLDSAIVVPVAPPTPVCEHGALKVSLLGTKEPTA